MSNCERRGTGDTGPEGWIDRVREGVRRGRMPTMAKVRLGDDDDDCGGDGDVDDDGDEDVCV